MNAAERHQEVRDASAAVARGEANPRQKTLHDSKIKSEAKNQKKRRDSLAAVKAGNANAKQKAHRFKVSNTNAKSSKDVSEARTAEIVGQMNTEQKAVLVGIRKSEAKTRDAKLASRAEMLEDVENGTSDLKMVDTSNQDEVNKYKKRLEEVVTAGHGKGNLIYVCEGEMIIGCLL